jgi:hypothetical protein
VYEGLCVKQFAFCVQAKLKEDLDRPAITCCPYTVSTLSTFCTSIFSGVALIALRTRLMCAGQVERRSGPSSAVYEVLFVKQIAFCVQAKLKEDQDRQAQEQQQKRLEKYQADLEERVRLLRLLLLLD